MRVSAQKLTRMPTHMHTHTHTLTTTEELCVELQQTAHILYLRKLAIERLIDKKVFKLLCLAKTKPVHKLHIMSNYNVSIMTY